MNTKYDQLKELKNLLDSGLLTQEEFDKAKQRVLDNSIQPVSSDKLDESQESNKKTMIDSVKNKKWIIILIAIAIIIVTSIVLSNRDTTPPRYEYSDYTSAHSSDDNSDYDSEDVNDIIVYEDTIADAFVPSSRWHINYFNNEWGEPNKEDAFLYTTIGGNAWNIRVDYIPSSEEYPYGSFRFSIRDKYGYLEKSSGPVYIIVRGPDGETKNVEVAGTNNSLTFVEDPATVYALKLYFDQYDFDIKMEFDKWLERHSTQGRWIATPGDFQKAIETLL